MSLTLLTEETTLQIRKLVLQGKQYVEIQDELDISENTWDSWVYRDTHGFRKLLNEAKHERLIKLSEKVSKEILEASTVDENGRIATDVLRIKQKESEFIRETLGKDNYSKRSELTGKDGDAVNLGVIMLPPKEKKDIDHDMESMMRTNMSNLGEND